MKTQATSRLAREQPSRVRQPNGSSAFLFISWNLEDNQTSVLKKGKSERET